MGRKKLDISKKKTPITIKVDERLREKIQINMKAAGYNCRAVYLRDLIEGKNIIAKKGKPTELKKIKELREIQRQIKKIGTNYNQRVRVLNAIYNKVKNNGEPVINTAKITNNENYLEELTLQLIKIANNISQYIQEETTR